MIICGVLVRVVVSVIRQNYSSKKHLFGKLVLACEDETLNTTKICWSMTAWSISYVRPFINKKVACKKLLSYLHYFIDNYCYFAFLINVIIIIQIIG